MSNRLGIIWMNTAAALITTLWITATLMSGLTWTATTTVSLADIQLAQALFSAGNMCD
jgi:hypothetical protein